MKITRKRLCQIINEELRSSGLLSESREYESTQADSLRWVAPSQSQNLLLHFVSWAFREGLDESTAYERNTTSVYDTAEADIRDFVESWGAEVGYTVQQVRDWLLQTHFGDDGRDWFPDDGTEWNLGPAHLSSDKPRKIRLQSKPGDVKSIRYAEFFGIPSTLLDEPSEASA